MSNVDGRKMRELRQRLGLSQDEMARRAGVDERTIRRAERGQTQPHGETLRIIATTLGVSVADLLSEDALVPGTDRPTELVLRDLSPPPGPALAVLPFDDWGDSAREPYFVAGLLEDMVSRVSMLRMFPVISRYSTLQFAGSGIAPQDVSTQLGARYLVSGSVRRDTARVRVSASLIDGATGFQLWCDSYDSDRQDLLAVQDEISRRVAAALAPVLLRNEQRLAARRTHQEMSAWDAAVLGLWHLDRESSEDNEIARGHFGRACGIDPTFVLPWFGAALSHYRDLAGSGCPSPELAAAKLEETSRHAQFLDPDDPQALVVRGYAHMMAGDSVSARGEFERAVELNPSTIYARLALGQVVAAAGEANEALEILEDGVRLSPCDPKVWRFEASMCFAELVAGRHEAALHRAERAARSGPRTIMVEALITALLMMLGRDADARRHAATVRTRWPQLQGKDLVRVLSWVEPGLLKEFIAMLGRAGI